MTVSGNTSPKRKIILIAACAIVLASLGLAVLLVVRWPFRRSTVLKDLEEASLTRVQYGSFRETYFPRPGCVLENVIFQHNPRPGSPPLITIERLRIESTFAGLFTSHVRRIRAEGLRLLVPALGSGEKFEVPERSTFVIDELIADEAVLEIASNQSGKRPLAFSFSNFSLRNIGSHGPATFHARFSNPEPPGEITASGKFGPWSSRDVGQTAVSGEYIFRNADLGVFQGIGGLLASSGTFRGTLGRIQVSGDADVPDFAVTRSTHHVSLSTKFQAEVNAQNGDTFLDAVDANFRKTTVQTRGSIAHIAGQPGKAVTLQIASASGRIQDILLLFVRSPRAPMSGQVRFHGEVAIPPEEMPFLEKVRIEGDFGIGSGGFTKPSTQRDVNLLSAGALGENLGRPEQDDPDPATVLSDLRGHVSLNHGTATFSDLSFGVPGAQAEFAGTYNLISERVDLHGTLQTQAEVARTTRGIKAFLLKVLEPLFRKKPVGYVVPVKITGTYEHPSFGLDLIGEKKSTDAKP